MTEILIFFGVGNNASGDYCTIWKSNGKTSGISPLEQQNFGFNQGTTQGKLSGTILLGYGDMILAQDYVNGAALLFVYYKLTATPKSFNYVNNTGAMLSPYGFVAYNGVAYFNGLVFGLGNVLLSTKGALSSNGNDVIINQISNDNLNPSFLTVAFGKIFFSGINGQNTVLYSWGGAGQPAPVGIDITDPASLLVSPVGTGIAFNPLPDFPEPTPHYPLFMSGTDPTGIWLFMYDGSKLTKIAPYALTGSSPGLAPYNLVNLEWETVIQLPIGPHQDVTIMLRHNAVCFSGFNQNGHRELWMVTADANGNLIASGIHIPSFLPRSRRRVSSYRQSQSAGKLKMASPSGHQR